MTHSPLAARVLLTLEEGFDYLLTQWVIAPANLVETGSTRLGRQGQGGVKYLSRVLVKFPHCME